MSSKGKNTVIKSLQVLCSRRFLLFLLCGQAFCASGFHSFSWAGASNGTATLGAGLGWSQYSPTDGQPYYLNALKSCYLLEIREDLSQTLNGVGPSRLHSSLVVQSWADAIACTQRSRYQSSLFSHKTFQMQSVYVHFPLGIRLEVLARNLILHAQ